MKNIKLILILSFAFFVTHTVAQPTCYFEHYSTEDGLPQFIVTDILQDHKGFMWFATWDGFSKFDGNTFRNFKVRAGDLYQMESNRIRHISEDRRGNMWLHTYGNEAHCFSPYTETFVEIEELQNLYPTFKLSNIKMFASGNIWLVSNENGCVCVNDSTFTVEVYNKDNGRLKSNHVQSVFEDKNQQVWILTNNGLSLLRKDETIPTSYFFENTTGNGIQSFFAATELSDKILFASNKGRIWEYDKALEKFNLLQVPTDANLTAFLQLTADEILITTETDGFFVCRLSDNSFDHYNTTTVAKLKDNKIRMLLLDNKQRFWFETEEIGIYQFDRETKKISYYVVDINDPSIKAIPPASDIVQDIHGQLWIHPRGGGFSFYDEETDKLVPFHNNVASSEWRFSNILHSLYSDKQGNLWFCTRTHGLEKATFNNNRFKTIIPNPKDNTPIANEVRAVLQDCHRRLWVATKDQRLAIYDDHYHLLGYFSQNGTIGQKQPFEGIVYTLFQDDENNIWLGTRTDGLFKLTPTHNPNHYVVEHFKKDAGNIYSISEDVVYSIFQDSNQNIWIGTYGGGLNLVRTAADGKTYFINHKNNLKNYPIDAGARVRYISENKFGNICIGTTMGLIMFQSRFDTPDNIEYKHYTRTPGNSESLGNNDIHGICNTANGEMFLATFGGGINKVVHYDAEGFPVAFQSYTVHEGFPSDVCLAIAEDRSGKLWVSMENNLSKFDPVKEEIETFAEIKKLMSKNSFSEASTCSLENGDLVFGFSGGLLYFSPEEIKSTNFAPYIALSDFRLHNQSVTIGEKNSPLQKNIDDVAGLTLAHNQNSFSIEYAALDFIHTNNILYAYMLEGFDSDWVYAQKARIANYTNIPKGNYTFRVKSTNSEGVWVSNERRLSVEVLPPFWATTWAFVLYVLLFFAAIYGVVRILFTFYRLRKKMEIEKYLSEMKLRFFTDISHEIRTPLTMISAPVDYLLAEKDVSEKVKEQLSSISQNTNRMLRLVNQVLDLRKIQQSKLQVKEICVGSHIKTICNNFNEIAQRHRMNFAVSDFSESQKIWIAPESLEIIMMNILSNAFKYTPNGKSINVTIRNEEKQLLVEVKDEGCGISKEKQKRIFTRFTSFNEDPTKPSTGIGLSIVNDLMNKHGGKVQLESEVNSGTTFTLIFLKGTAHFGKEVELIAATSADWMGEQPEVVAASDADTAAPHKSLEKEHSILVIEDNTELRRFIKTILEQDYTVFEAEDGLDGLEKAEAEAPDFIVSDIMMPNMDGIELLKRLKNNINTSHIPVILLTAKTAIESKLEGLISGADDYITKPFSVQYFRARINNLLEQRKRLQEAYRARIDAAPDAAVTQFAVSSQDEAFIKKTIDTIEAHLDESEFTIDHLSVELNMSRSVFSNKIKSLTGLPPFDFIRDIKMRKAAQLLLSGKYMVKEVSSMIGISDTKHFGKIFKAKYGVSPQEYKGK
ncbi:hybrid sensor histidine kinase/response regulator [Bacteroides sp. 214]|uniref:hybrid sensor histidine kinase/response regulator transcription factor n=1 Tax=Bacteroides sp. 214 TaxID=2302935 RepID=UPI0013D236D8|nr:two-component regulator propeller domain-containing protein [Bacteroides sp. 214]NDW13740.1 hybrid sensor histidine kinase/response regulator [Bacteroides sp. 214]